MKIFFVIILFLTLSLGHVKAQTSANENQNEIELLIKEASSLELINFVFLAETKHRAMMDLFSNSAANALYTSTTMDQLRNANAQAKNLALNQNSTVIRLAMALYVRNLLATQLVKFGTKEQKQIGLNYLVLSAQFMN
jgi:preprotein translocase subunit SecG